MFTGCLSNKTAEETVDLSNENNNEIKYELSEGIYIISGYEADHMEYTPVNNSSPITGQLYYVNPYFLGDYFKDKVTEGGSLVDR